MAISQLRNPDTRSYELHPKIDFNVIGLLEVRGSDGQPHVRLNASASTPLEAGDILVVLGRDEKLEALEKTMRENLTVNS